MDGKQLFATSEDTPHGGVIFPLLANIALHGMENRIKQYAQTLPGILHEDIAVVQRCQGIISEWLLDMGLELKPSKTR
jgi:RNA-directed DNA polymerase